MHCYEGVWPLLLFLRSSGVLAPPVLAPILFFYHLFYTFPSFAHCAKDGKV